MGMLKEGVRLDRVRGGRQKYRRNPVANPYQMLLPQSTTYITPTCLEDIKMLETLIISEPELLPMGNLGIEMMNKMTTADGKETNDVKTSDLIGAKLSIDAQEMLSILSDIYDKELVGVIGWAKQIPGFIIYYIYLHLVLYFVFVFNLVLI